MRLIGGVLKTKSAQNGVTSERKQGRKKKKNVKEKKKKRRKRREKKERKRNRDSLYPGWRGLSHFEEDFLQI